MSVPSLAVRVLPLPLRLGGVDCAATYLHEPGDPRDGLTVTVPLLVLNQVSEDRVEWLVPGMLKEKAHLLLKSLPQKLRRHCVPLPDYAAGFVGRVRPPAADGEPYVKG